MKALRIILLVVFLFSLSACGGSSTETPATGAQAWLQGLIANDAAKIADRLCSDKVTMKPAEMWAMAFGKNAPAFSEAGKADITGLKFAVQTELRDSGYVKVTGTLKVGTQSLEVDQLWLASRESAKWKWCGD
jgi:uncharacterized protein YxeA